MKISTPYKICFAGFVFSSIAHAGTIMVSVVDSGDLDPGPTYDLDTLGSLDWKIYSSSLAGTETKSGGSGISALSTSGFTEEFASTSFNPLFSWTGGTPTSSATGSDPNFAKSPNSITAAESFSLTSAATTDLRTLYIYAGVSRASATLNLSLSDGSALPVAALYDIGNNFGHITYKIDYSADAASGETLNVSWDKTTHEGGTGVSSIPRP